MHLSLPYAAVRSLTGWVPYVRAWIAVLLLTFTLLPARAANVWDGGGANADWGTPENWDDDNVPGPTADVTIGTGFASGSPTIGVSSYTINSLTLNPSSFLAIGGVAGSTLTLASGDLAKTTTSLIYLNANVELGDDGTWSNATGSGSGSLRVYGVISDGGNGHSLTLSTGRFDLNNANTFSGDLITQSAASVIINNNQALGLGTFRTASGSTFYGANTIANNIVFENVAGFVGIYSSSSASATNDYSTTFTGSLTGSLNGQQLRFGGTGRTWNFGTVNLTDLQSSGLQLTPEEANGHSSYVFSSSPVLSNGNILLGGTATGATGNLLMNQAGTFSGNRITLRNGGGVDTIGGMHTTGTVTYAMTDILLVDTTAGETNLVSRHAGAVTDFSALLTDDTGTSAVRVNGDYQQVNTASSAGLTAPVYETVSSTGIVRFSHATGNTYDGGTTVARGTLLAANSSGSATGTGAVSVLSGATLGGNGIIAPTGTAGVTLASGATLAPGESIGTLRLNGAATSGTLLTMQSGAEFSFELAASGTSDELAFWNYTLGDLSLADNVINFENAGGLSAGTYTLFTFYDDDGMTLTASGISSGLQIGTGLEAFAGSYLDYGVDTISLVVVPESSSLSLLLLGAAAFRLRRRAA